MTDTELFKEYLDRLCRYLHIIYKYEAVGHFKFYDDNSNFIGEADFAGLSFVNKTKMLIDTLGQYLK